MNRWIGRGLVSLLSLLTTTAFAGIVFFRIVGPTDTEITGIDQDGTIIWTNSTVGVTVTVRRATSLLGDGDWRDHVHKFVDTPSMSAKVADPGTPEGMVFIPGGLNTGTNPLTDYEYHDDGYPETYSLTSSSFYMDKYPVTKSGWDDVYNWAIAHGYTFDHTGLGKALTHPVHTISWYDAIKWCNARSEMEGRQPAYYITNVFESVYVYRSGQNDLEVDWVRSEGGYRLPTETEWEYAARGGLTSKRFPLDDTISHADANFLSNRAYPYDLNTNYWRTHHQSYEDGTKPYTSPVGEFTANGYGLFDMVGNVFQWIFDWDPGSNQSGRIMRGGSWNSYASSFRVGYRVAVPPDGAQYSIGLRAVLFPGSAAAP